MYNDPKVKRDCGDDRCVSCLHQKSKTIMQVELVKIRGNAIRQCPYIAQKRIQDANYSSYAKFDLPFEPLLLSSLRELEAPAKSQMH